MVQYTCERCKLQFNKKSTYDDHLHRKIPCSIKLEPIENNKENYCKICDRHFSRSDALKRHQRSQMHKSTKGKQVVNNYAKTRNGNINQVIGDKNVIINKNYYFISPFNHEEIDKLTPEEKLAIFASNENPIVMIIIKTNLNPIT